MFNATCTEYQFRYNYGLSTNCIERWNDTVHFDSSEINEVVDFIDQQLIPPLNAETEDLEIKYGGLDKFIDVFYEQTNFLTRIGVHDKEYFDFDPRSIIFDLNNFREVLLEAHSLNKAHRAYFD